MSAEGRLTAVVLATQVALGAAGIAAASWSRVPLRLGPRPGLAVLAGLGAAALLGALNHRWLRAPRGVFRDVRAAVDDVLVPTFGGLGAGQIVAVSVAAGVGEELFFRGWLQAIVGWWPAALAFGAAHVAGARMLALGVWATGMGLVMGGLTLVTGGLLASMTAHACYDVLAFQFLRKLARPRAGAEV